MTNPKQGGLWETVKTVVYAILIALGIRTFAYEPFNIPSGSMIPTLLVGDYLFVSKFSYGYSRYSFPFSPPLFNGRILQQDVDRGDVAVFKLPRDGSTDYIKRIVGLPGDRIQMKKGILYINDQPVERKRIEGFEPGVRGGVVGIERQRLFEQVERFQRRLAFGDLEQRSCLNLQEVRLRDARPVAGEG